MKCVPMPMICPLESYPTSRNERSGHNVKIRHSFPLISFREAEPLCRRPFAPVVCSYLTSPFTSCSAKRRPAARLSRHDNRSEVSEECVGRSEWQLFTRSCRIPVPSVYSHYESLTDHKVGMREDYGRPASRHLLPVPTVVLRLFTPQPFPTVSATRFLSLWSVHLPFTSVPTA